MALTRIQQKVLTDGGTEASLSFDTAPSSGNLIMVYVTKDKAVGTVLFTNATKIGQGGNTNVTIAQAYRIADGTNPTITASWDVYKSGTMVIEEWGGWSGTPTFGPYSISATDENGVTSVSTGTTSATTNASALALALGGMDSGPATDITVTNSFTVDIIYNVDATPIHANASKELTSTQTVETTFTFVGRVDQAGAMVAVFEDVGGATPPPPMLSLGALF